MKNKKANRVKVYFTIDPNILSEFEKFLEEKYLNKSKLIEGFIVEYMKNNK